MTVEHPPLVLSLSKHVLSLSKGVVAEAFLAEPITVTSTCLAASR